MNILDFKLIFGIQNMIDFKIWICVQVSVPDLGDSMVPALATMYQSLRPVLKGLNLWQVVHLSTMLHVLECHPQRWASQIYEPVTPPL